MGIVLLMSSMMSPLTITNLTTKRVVEHGGQMFGVSVTIQEAEHVQVLRM